MKLDPESRCFPVQNNVGKRARSEEISVLVQALKIHHVRNLARFVTSVSASVSWAIKLGPDLSGLQGPAELQQVCDSEHAPTLFRQLGRPWKTSPSFSSLPVLSRSLDPCPSCLSVPTRPPQSSSLQQLWNAHTQVLGSEGGGHLRNTSGVSLHGISRKSFLREKWGSRSRPRRWLFQKQSWCHKLDCESPSTDGSLLSAFGLENSTKVKN